MDWHFAKSKDKKKLVVFKYECLWKAITVSSPCISVTGWGLAGSLVSISHEAPHPTLVPLNGVH